MWIDSNKSPGATETLQGLPPQNPQAASSSTNEWLKLAKDAFQQSTTYFDNNVRKQVEDGLRLFNSQHPRDSKYNNDAYKYRSRIFRPKTRSVIRKHEASAYMALFSSPDFTNIDPVDEENPNQVASAGINKQLLQYRLNKSIPWPIIAMGSYQDAMKVGICASFNHWEYEEEEVEEEVQADFFGQPLSLSVKKSKPLVDRPVIDLLAIENIRFHPAAKWYDVVGTSPYLVIQIPMYLRDALVRMEKKAAKGEPEWKTLSKTKLLEARITDVNPVQQARDQRKEDPQTQTSTVNEYDLIMVHLNFIKVDSKCYVYYTLKDLELLSDPVPLKEVFLHGKIPVTIGFCVIETHKTNPPGLSNLGQQLQSEANEIGNQRLDNVKYVLNKRKLVRRGSNVDVEGMLRNVPGGITMVNDIEKDVKNDDVTDVTASSYQEQDRVNADYDDLLGGNLSSSSVMTNRRLGETVGGMKMLAQGGNAVGEYTFAIWKETWVEPTLSQLVLLEQHYESDEVILSIAAKKAGQYERFSMSSDLDSLLQQELTVTVNAGMGATDPQQRFQSFMQATGAYAQIVQMSQMMGDLNLPEVRKELFGLAGWRDSARFFGKVDPRWQQAQMMVQQAQGMAQQIVDKAKDRLLRREMQLERRTTDLDMKELSLDSEAAQLQNDMNLELQRMQQEFQIDVKQQMLQYGIDVKKANLDMTIEWMKAQQDAKLEEFKARLKMRLDAMLANAKARQIAAQPAKREPADG